MPIYEYKCESCGHAKDVLQKMSDAPLSVCPACGQSSFQKQVTAAGFQLKGSGWYVTDFRGGNNTQAPTPGDASGAEAPAKPAGDAAAGAAPGAVAATGTAAPAPAPAASAPAPAAGPTPAV